MGFSKKRTMKIPGETFGSILLSVLLPGFLCMAGTCEADFALSGGSPQDTGGDKLNQEDVTVQSDTASLEINNGLVAVDLRKVDGRVAMTFKARQSDTCWQEVCRSFTPDFVTYPAGNRFFDTTVTPRRYQVSEIVRDFAVVKQTQEEVVVRLWGHYGRTLVEEILSLRKGRPFVHVTVCAELEEPELDYLMHSFTFSVSKRPEFIHSPTAKLDDPRSGPACNQVIGDHAFHAPAIILQEGGLFMALVPDLNAINQHRVISPDARRKQNIPFNRFSVPIEDDKYTMPTALDLNVVSGLTEKPVVSYGMMDFIISHHIRYQRMNDTSMIRTLNEKIVQFEFDLFLGAEEPVCRGYQQVARYQWRKYGHDLAKCSQLPLSFDEYVRTIYAVVSEPMDSEVQPPVPGYDNHGVFIDFEMNGLPVGGMVSPLAALGFGDALWNCEFWNNVRDACGMYYWGKKLEMPELVCRAQRIVNLALNSPQNNAGFFHLVYLSQSKQWLRSTIGPSPNPATIFAQENQLYDVPAMSKTAAHLLEYFQRCEQNPQILAYLRPYGDGLLARIDERGIIPSYYTPEMRPCDALRFSAQGAASMWFLAEFAAVTGERKYLDGAKRIAEFLMKDILPRQLWLDMEPYFSCGQNPLSLLADYEQCLPIRGNLSAFWAARGFASLYRASKEKIYLDAGEAVIDYISFSQACWAPHYIYTAFPFGGFTADNIDTATWLDARQCEMVAPFIWYGRNLGRQDLIERGVAAARASVTLINHPLHKTNGIYRHTNFYGFGLGPENINHEGHNQSALRTHPGWGECSGTFTGLGDADRLFDY